MGMFDTYVPCNELQEVIKKEIKLKDFDWQTKSLDCNLDDYIIDENLQLWLNNKESFLDIVDTPYVDKGLLFLEIKNGVLKTLLLSFNHIHAFGVERIPDILMTFNSITDYKVTKIYDFDNLTKELRLRNYLYESY